MPPSLSVAGSLRVTHVITGLSVGGAERMLTRIVLAARERGESHDVISLTGMGNYGSALERAGVTVDALEMRLRRPWRAWRLPLILRRRRPDVVMTWLYHADLLGLAASVAAGLHPRRVIWNIRCADLDAGGRFSALRALTAVAARLSPLPGVVATNSAAGRRHHEGLGYRPRRWLHLPNGLDPELWRPDAADRAAIRAAVGVAEDAVLIGMVGRVDANKDHGNFLQAAAIVAEARPQALFLLVGDGAADLELPPALCGRLTLFGRRDDIPRLMRALDVHVLSSSSEGFPNVLCEAMASGTACVSTDVGDAANILGGVGLIVPPRDAAALAAAMIAVTDEGAAGRARRGAAGRRRVLEHYDLAAVERRYAAALANAAGLPVAAGRTEG